MNITNLYHTLYALLIQAVVLTIGGNVLVGASAGSFFFIGREIAQAEYRWIKQFGKGKRANMPETGGLDWRVWRGEYDAIFDWLLPSVVVWAVAYLCVTFIK